MIVDKLYHLDSFTHRYMLCGQAGIKNKIKLWVMPGI